MINRLAQSKNTRYHNNKSFQQSSGQSFHWTFLIFAFALGFFLLALPLASGATTNESGSPTRSSTNDVADNGPVIGIDLGTTYSCMGVFKNGKVEILPNEQGNRITPSYVAFTDTNERLVGDAAKNQATINPQNTIFDVKRLIGRRYSDASVQADKKLVPFTIVGDIDDQPRIKVGDALYAPEEISAMVLRKMKEIAENSLGQEVKRAVITVPAYFNQQQILSTKDAGAIAGLHVDRIIKEPTAAAIAYGIDKNHEDDTVLVFDLGGGTFDVTLLEIDNGVFEVLSTSGDTHLGGEDVDQRIMQYFIKKMQKSGRDVSKDSRALQKLRKEVERVKRSLSSQTQARVEIDDLVPGYDFVETLTRARFEELNNDLFQKTLGPVKKVLENAGKSTSDVDRIILVGGSTRIPKIQSLLSEYFGKPVYTGIDPDEAVAKGAAIQAAILSRQHDGALNEVVLVDKVSLSMGIETVGGIMTNIVPRDTTLPAEKSQTFSTHSDNQSTVSILVFEGERGMTKDNHLLGRFDLSGIPPAPRGIPQIEVTFEVDTNNILQVTAVDKGTGKAKKITITADQGRLSKEQIDRMTKEAEMNAEEDKKQVNRIQARNGLESYCYNLKHTLDSSGEEGGLSISQADKKELNDMVDETLDWLDAHQEADQEEFDEKMKEIQTVANPVMRRAYDGSGGAGGGHGSEGGEDFYDDEL